ncbi:hypothetical protein E2R48_09290 [Histophilus somni]|uniref:YadA domain protein n=5 Tax=Histophilus somni TaxID=731 RepID=A0AAX2RXI8_HISSO|nr:YadA-like family protein [Histophilus somni]TEW28036.1 hypothetical protein E2R48_09290 [Histophilus somni]
MNKIFKTKYDITTGQCKAVSELASNRQVASSSEKPKCGGLFGEILGLFKVLPLAFMIAGFLGVSTISNAAWLAINKSKGTVGIASSGNEYGENNNNGNIVLGKKDLHRVSGQVTKLEKVVVIGAGDKTKATGEGLVAVGYGAQALRDGATAVGYEAAVAGEGGTAVGKGSKAQSAQATAIGNNVYAAAQGTALGADVMAAGESSIAIGSDDIFANGKKGTFGANNIKAGLGGFEDRLPEETIKLIYGYNGNSEKVTYKDLVNESEFTKKYIRSDSGEDHRIYSPTYAAGVGAIAIGSRSVGYGNASLAMGTLSFALADRATAVGVRAFVGLGADGATAIGDSSRVFAKNSYAIGNAAESTAEGSLSFGSGAKAVGMGSIAIGPNVSSNAELTHTSAEKFRAQIMQETNLGNVTENQDPWLKTVTTDINDLKVGDHNEIVKYGFPANHFNGQNKISDLITKLEKENKFTYEKENHVEITTTEDIKKTKKQGDHAISLGYHISNNGDNTIAIGSASYVRGANSVVLGALNNVGKYATNTIAIGVGTNVHKENSVAIGTGVTVIGARAIGIGSGVGIKKDNSIAIGYGSSSLSESSMALGNDSKINENAKNSVALGNNSSSSSENSVALGYRSTTNYFYKDDTDKTTASLGGTSASNLEGYVPEGSSYRIETDTSAGVISVGGWDTTKDAKGGSVSGSSKGNKNHVGLRRIVNVAPGALDSDAATVGQLRALYYVKKEGLVVYYTEEGGKKVKLVKSADDKKFYKVDTQTGEPLKDSQAISEDKVLVGAKGFDEKIGDKDLGNKIQFGNLKDGKIAQNSDQAITGNQLNQLGGILGLTAKGNAKTEFNSHNFTAVEYIGSSHGSKNTFKGAIDELITAVNKGYKFDDGTNNSSTKDTPFYLGSTIVIKAGNIQSGGKATHLGKNLKTEFKNDSSKPTFTIGLKDDPEFKTVKLTGNPTDDKHAVNKKYVDDKFKNVATSFNVNGDNGTFKVTSKLDIKGDNGNIKTNASGSAVTISLKDTLTGISSIAGKNGNSGNKIDFTNSDGLKLSSKSGSTITLKRDGLDLGNKKITQLAKGIADKDAANFGQLQELATTVLGATVNSGGFTKSTFNQLIGSNGATASTPAIQKTFKQAIDDNIDKINMGFKFGDATETGTHYLGDTLKIQAGNITVDETALKTKSMFSSDNIRTSYQKDSKTLFIGIKENPSFKMVSVSEDVTEHSNEKVLTTKKYVDDKVNNLSSNLKFQADSGGEKTLPLKTGTLKVKGTANQIKTSVEGEDTIKIGLDEKITKKIDDTATKADKNEKAITAVKTSIEGKITDQVIKYKANGSGDYTVKLSDGLNFKDGTNTTAVVESNGVVKFNVNEALKEIASIAGKEVNGGNGGTKVKTEIKFNENSKGNNANTNVVILSNGASYTFDPKGFHVGNKKITALASGLGLTNGTGGNAENNSTVIANVLTGNPNGMETNAINVKDLSEVAKAIVEKGLSFEGNGGSTDKVTRKLGDTLKFVGKGSDAKNITVADNNIKVSKKAETNGSTADTLEIGLSDTLKGIKSIENGDNAKITLGGENGKDKTITFTAGDQTGSKDVTLSAGKFSNVSEINKADGKGALKLEDDKATVTAGTDKGTLKVEANKATLESAKDKSKLELAEDSATLSAGKDKGSIKVTNGTTNKIELSPEKDITVTLTKDTANGNKVKATGLSSVGLDDSNALVFKNGSSGTGTDKTAELKVGGAALTFTSTGNGTGGTAQTVKISNVAVGNIATDSKDAITGGQLHDLASKLGVAVDSGKTTFTAPSFTKINGATNGTNPPTTFKGAIEQLITAVNGGLTFKGNDTSSSKTTLQLGGTLTIDSSPVSSTTGTNGAVEKDITVTLTPSTTGDAKEAGTLTLKLNKATTVSDSDEKVVTSKAVAEKLKEYTSTATLGKDFLKVDGSNINGKQDEFGKNVGIDNINLSSDKESTKLVQTKALVKYLKGTGDKSVKISDNPETKADGEGSIAVGDKAIAQNVGAVAIGQNSGAKNNGAISIGKGSDVTEKDGIAIGTGTKVSGQSSVAIGEKNEVSNAQSYVLGSENNIKGRDVVAIGSKITADDKIHDAVILGNGSTGEANTVSVGGPGVGKQRRIIYVDTPKNKYDAVNKNYVDELKITYKANGNGATDKKQTVKLTDGLDFKKGENDNIQVKVAENGSIQHNLANQLKDINSIWGGKDEMGAKITLETAKKEISFNDSKLKNLADGEIAETSKEAVTGKQLADLAKQLGIAVDDKNKTAFKQPSFNNLKLKEVAGTDGKAPTSIVDGLQNTVKKLNEGLKFSADQSAVTNGTQNTPHYLGSTINIVRLASNTAGTSSQPNIAEFKGDNLITQYTSETNGNAKIEIGFKDAPMFEKVMLSQKQMYENGKNSKVGENDLITKSYLEEALSSFKFKVENGGGQTVEIGRGDTLKFTSGQNIKVDLAKNGTTPSSTGSTSPSASAPAPTPAAPAPASSAAPSSSSGGAGSNGGGSNSMASSGGSNGAGMATTTPTSTPTTTTPTTAVVTIGTTEELKNITSISSKPKDGSAGGNGEVTKLTLDPTDGATFQVGTTGSKVKIDKEGISLTPQGANNTGGANPFADTASITIKAGAKPADPKSLDSLDPNNGPSIEFSAKKTSDGKSIGTGKITGLKDLEANSDGSSAVNKNYVDKLDKVAVKYDSEAKDTITLGGKPQNGGKAHDPVAIKNLKSALGIDNDSMKGKSESEKQGKSLDLVKKLVSDGMSSQQGQKMTEQQDLHQAANLADLKAVAQAGLRFKGNQGDDVVRKISDTLTIKGEENATTGSSATDKFNSTTTAAGNIKVEANTAKNGLEIKLSDTLKNMKAFETKEDGGKKATLNSEGLKVVNNKNGNGKDISATYGADNIMLEDKGKNNKATITAESLTFADNVAQNQQNPKMPKAVLNKNGLTVTGANGEIKIDGENGIITVPDIKPTTSESAVVNKKYVDGQLSAAVNRLDNVISANNKRLQSGIAGANAAAALPTIAMPGKSALAVSAGTYRGQSAVALGYSRVSDNGKIMLKLHGNSTSTGDFGGGVGIGWAW